jgi:tetratricopeptide (TPR) repeat protein
MNRPVQSIASALVAGIAVAVSGCASTSGAERSATPTVDSSARSGLQAAPGSQNPAVPGRTPPEATSGKGAGGPSTGQSAASGNGAARTEGATGVSATGEKPVGAGPGRPDSSPSASATDSTAAPSTGTSGQASPARPEGRVSHDPAFTRGIDAFRASKWPEAAEAFADALRAVPNDVDAQFNLALTEERRGRLDRARAAYRSALQLAPDHLPSLANLARLERQGGHAEGAVQLLVAASQRPGLAANPELWVQLSAAHRSAGDLPAAETAARRVLALRRDAGGYEALALVALAQGRTRMAQLLAESARKLDDARASTHVTLGLIAYRMDEVGGARAEFERAVALDPSLSDGWMNLGALASGWRDYAGAERAYRHAADLEPWNPEARLFLADALAAQRTIEPTKGKAAAEVYRQVLALVPDSARAVCGAGWTLGDLGDRSSLAEAQQLLRRCRQAPSTANAERERIDARLQALDSLARAPSNTGGAERAGRGVGGSGAVERGGTGKEAR